MIELWGSCVYIGITSPSLAWPSALLQVVQITPQRWVEEKEISSSCVVAKIVEGNQTEVIKLIFDHTFSNERLCFKIILALPSFKEWSS